MDPDHDLICDLYPWMGQVMEDQVKGLQQNGVKAAYLNYTLRFNEANSIQHRAAKGFPDILYVAPEKLLTPQDLGSPQDLSSGQDLGSGHRNVL